MSKQVITLEQMQGAMAQGHTAEAILAQYDCPEYVAAVQAQAAQTANVAAIPTASAAAFDLMAFAATAAPAAGREKRTPAWECTIEELRTRVIIRDVQTPQKKDEANAKLRIQLAPQYVSLAAYGTLPDGSPIVHFVVPRAQQAAAEAKLKADVESGMHDAALKEAAEKCRLSAEKKKANAANKKAPQDQEAAAAALAALEANAAPAVGGVAGTAGGEVSLEQSFDMAMGAPEADPGVQLGAGLNLPTL